MVCYAIVSFFLLLYKLFLGNVSFQQISNLSNAYPRHLRNLLVAPDFIIFLRHQIAQNENQ